MERSRENSQIVPLMQRRHEKPAHEALQGIFLRTSYNQMLLGFFLSHPSFYFFVVSSIWQTLNRSWQSKVRFHVDMFSIMQYTMYQAKEMYWNSRNINQISNNVWQIKQNCAILSFSRITWLLSFENWMITLFKASVPKACWPPFNSHKNLQTRPINFLERTRLRKNWNCAIRTRNTYEASHFLFVSNCARQSSTLYNV